MNFADISKYRLISQQIAETKFSLPKQLVEYMGAIQAQDLPMALLAIASRTKNANIKTIEQALNCGEIIRTHLMRPTWHIVSKDDIYWMLDLTAQPLKRIIGRRYKEMDFNDELMRKANNLLEKNLQGRELSREEIGKIFAKNSIRTDENRLSHFLMNAELNQLICSGSVKGRLQTYTLLEEKVPEKKRFSREESILKLTETYFKSHAPATVADFAWWSFLSLKEIRWALEELKNKFDSEKIGEETYYFSPEISKKQLPELSIFLLPAYDEFLVSYQSKHVSVKNQHQRKAVSANGIFYPVIVKNGQIVGTWKKSSTKKSIEIKTDFFDDKKLDISLLLTRIKSLY